MFFDLEFAPSLDVELMRILDRDTSLACDAERLPLFMRRQVSLLFLGHEGRPFVSHVLCRALGKESPNWLARAECTRNGHLTKLPTGLGQADSEVVAAVDVGGQLDRFTPANAQFYREGFRTTSQRISEMLGWR